MVEVRLVGCVTYTVGETRYTNNTTYLVDAATADSLLSAIDHTGRVSLFEEVSSEPDPAPEPEKGSKAKVKTKPRTKAKTAPAPEKPVTPPPAGDDAGVDEKEPVVDI